MSMKLGLAVPAYRRFAERDTMLRVAQTADEHGYYSTWVPDHLVNPAENRRRPRVLPHPLLPPHARPDPPPADLGRRQQPRRNAPRGHARRRLAPPPPFARGARTPNRSAESARCQAQPAGALPLTPQ